MNSPLLAFADPSISSLCYYGYYDYVVYTTLKADLQNITTVRSNENFK